MCEKLPSFEEGLFRVTHAAEPSTKPFDRLQFGLRACAKRLAGSFHARLPVCAVRHQCDFKSRQLLGCQCWVKRDSFGFGSFSNHLLTLLWPVCFGPFCLEDAFSFCFRKAKQPVRKAPGRLRPR